MQATVSAYDPDTRQGQVLTDAGRALTFEGSALTSHIRHLRPGQRVFIEATDAVVTSLSIWQ